MKFKPWKEIANTRKMSKQIPQRHAYSRPNTNP
jgi:hypothetical protein